MAREDIRGALVLATTCTLLFLVAPPEYGDRTLLEELLGVQMSGVAELAIGGVAVALTVALLAARRIPTDPDDREWISER